jgi:hypothetical protein
MATAKEITAYYKSNLGRTPSPEEIKSWQNTGLSTLEIAANIRNSPEAQNRLQSQTSEEIIANIYQTQLGREAEAEGLANWVNVLQSGTSAADIARQINQSIEGQNFDTQYITSLYRQNLERNPEQAGYQWWQSLAQSEGLTPAELQAILMQSATPELAARGIDPGTVFTEMMLPDLEADPFGGRYATNSIYNIPTNEADRINISYINGIPVQFVNPVTQQQYITQYGKNAWSEVAGDETLSVDRVKEALTRALSAGSMTNDEYNQIIDSLQKATKQKATKPEDIRNILGIPQGAVIIDPNYGQQIGEDNDLKIALAEAAKRQAVLSAQDPNYYQSSDVLGQAYLDAGLPWDFMSDTYKADTMMTQANKLTPENFQSKVNELLKSFGNANQMQTPGLGQYYSETGLQPGFTPFGTEGTTFRSGVAGFVPQAQLPTGFQFGAPPVDASFQQYRPGAFQPEGVTTGGFITGYNPNGTPIYSTYANPNQNVGGATSALNPFNSQAQFDAMLAASAAAANQG